MVSVSERKRDRLCDMKKHSVIGRKIDTKGQGMRFTPDLIGYRNTSNHKHDSIVGSIIIFQIFANNRHYPFLPRKR